MVRIVPKYSPLILTEEINKCGRIKTKARTKTEVNSLRKLCAYYTYLPQLIDNAEHNTRTTYHMSLVQSDNK
jgi:hypothetical protein